LFISRDKLPGLFSFSDEMLLDEADKTIAMCLALELEIKSLFLLDDANSLVVGVMSENELL
jgi:hypothetical protein